MKVIIRFNTTEELNEFLQEIGQENIYLPFPAKSVVGEFEEKEKV